MMFAFAACTNSNARNSQVNTTAQLQTSNKTSDGTKTLVAYFSATGSTEKVAQYIADELNADIFAITPETPYSSDDLDYNDDNSRVVREHNDKSKQTIALKQNTPDNWTQYDTVFIGYPIWWGDAAWIVSSFVKANDFNGKTVIPFCTSASSPLGSSDKDLASAANGGNWQDGKRFSSSADESEVKEWAKAVVK